MRIIAPIAILLLLFSAFWRFEQSVEMKAAASAVTEGVTPELSVRIYSRGEALPPYISSFRKKWRTEVYVDETVFFAGDGKPGLRVLSIPSDGSTPEIVSFDLHDGEGAVLAFMELLADVPEDTVLALASYGKISPVVGKAEKRRELIARVLTSLGAESDPTSSPGASFALLCVRRPEGFVKIAESLSSTRGIDLCHHVAADRSAYDRWHATTSIDNRTVVELPLAEVVREDIVLLPARRYQTVAHETLNTRPAFEAPVRISWDVEGRVPIEGALGPATFHAYIASEKVKHKTQEAVRFKLLVNDKLMGTRTILTTAGEVSAWIRWEVPLDSSFQSIDSLVVEIERIGPKGPPCKAQLAGTQLRVGAVESVLSLRE